MQQQVFNEECVIMWAQTGAVVMLSVPLWCFPDLSKNMVEYLSGQQQQSVYGSGSVSIKRKEKECYLDENEWLNYLWYREEFRAAHKGLISQVDSRMACRVAPCIESYTNEAHATENKETTEGNQAGIVATLSPV